MPSNPFVSTGKHSGPVWDFWGVDTGGTNEPNGSETGIHTLQNRILGLRATLFEVRRSLETEPISTAKIEEIRKRIDDELATREWGLLDG
jgi:hypothetical protein